MNASIPGSGHNHPPRDWLDVLRGLVRKLRGVYQEIVRALLRLVTTETLCRRVDAQLAEDARMVELHPVLSDDEARAVGRARMIARGDVP